MIQDQLVEYISSQLKLGVSRDAIRAALVGAGWVPGDVEDTFKKVEGGQPVLTPAQPVQPVQAVQTAKPVVMSSSSSPAATTFVSPVQTGGITKVQPKPSEPQTIRVSDLISASASPMGAASSSPSMTAGKGAVKTSPVMTSGMGMQGSSIMKSGMQSEKKGGSGIIWGTIAIVIIILLGGLSGYLYFQNENLSKNVSGVSAQSQGVTSQVSSLQAQVQSLTASAATLTSQVSSLTTQNQALQTNLSFFVVPVQTGSSTGPLAASSITVDGIVSGGSPIYILTTSYGVKTYVKNSATAAVRTVLQPLVASGATTEISGTYFPGSPDITVLTVNGASVTGTAPAAASTTPSQPAPSATQ